MLQDSNHSMSSSSGYYVRKSSSESSRRSNTKASAYAVDADTMCLTGFHFSTCSAGGVGWYVIRLPFTRNMLLDVLTCYSRWV